MGKRAANISPKTTFGPQTNYALIMKLNFLTTLILLPLFAAAQKTTPLTVGLTTKDSVFFTINSDGEKILQHVVKPKQTLFSMGKFYGIGLEELYNYNPEFRTSPDLSIGQIVKIPIPNAAISRYKGDGFDAKKSAKLFYTVKSGETLFNLCKRQFRMPVDSIIKRNKLASTTITVGQILHMGWISTDGIKAADRGGKVAEPSSLKGDFEKNAKKLKVKTASGTALWQKDANEKGDFYVLHRTAKIGTSMHVTNAANGKIVYAKVIGRVPTSSEKNTEIVLSPAAAKAVNALDARFLVNIKYVE